MTKRIITSVIGVPILIIVVYLGGLVLQAATLTFALFGIREFYAAVSKKSASVHMIGYVFTVAYVASLPWLGTDGILIFFTAFILALLISVVINHEKFTITDAAITFFGFFYVPFLMSFVYMTRAHKTGVYFAWLIFISAWGSDTFAYFTGKALGKHKLCPNLSPKKTVEGSLGGVIGATAMSVIYALLANKFALNLEVNMVFFCATIGFFGSMFSQFGDLAASAIKRQTGIKDFGYIIPGHGGALDRFDSMLFTAPSVFIVMYVLINYV